MANKKGKISVQPLGDRVLLKELLPEETETKTSTGIIIPDTVKGETKGAKRARVVAVGDGRIEQGKKIPVAVKEGDEVLFSWGEELTIDGDDYFLVTESNILAVVK
jgi:chaperonin GroES